MRRDVAVLAALAVVAYATLAGARDLWNPNEPIYGQAVVEMAAAGEWLVPQVNGEDFGEKPILYFWLARVAALVVGLGPTALRLPSALAGVAGVVLVYLLVAPYAAAGRARLAAAVFGTTYIVFWSARTVQMDLLLATCALGAIVAATRTLDHGLAPARGWALAGIAAGLGFLAKGPVALVVAGGPVLAYALVTGRGAALVRRPVLAGAAAFLAVAAPWFVALAVRGEHAVLYELLVRQTFERSLDPWDHAGPWWYYLREFWVDMAPWAWLVPLAFALPRRDGAGRRLDALAWCWIAVVVVFFSIPASKRSPYILPAAPAVAVLVSGLLERLAAGSLGRRRAGATLGVVAGFGVLLAAGGAFAWARVLPEYPAVGAPGRALAAVLVAGGATVAGAVLVPARRRAAGPVFAAVLAVSFWFAASFVLPRVDAYKSPRPFGEQVNAIVPPDAPLHAYRIWQWRAGYTYYTGRPIARVETPEELARRWRAEVPLWIVVERGMLDEFRAVVGPAAEPLADSAIGSNHAWLFANPAVADR